MSTSDCELLLQDRRNQPVIRRPPPEFGPDEPF